MPKDFVESLFIYEGNLVVDLENQEIIVNNIKENFEIKQDKKRRLLDGLDDIDLTLDSENIIELFEKNRTIPSII